MNQLIIGNFESALRFAEALSKSSMLPKEYQGNPGNVLVAMQYGHELGIGIMQAIQSVAVINGKPSVYGDTMLAIVRASGFLESISEDVADDRATCTVKRKGEQPITRVFTVEDAKRAGLWNKPGPWQQYPKRMLQMRARAYALRDVFPDVLRGLYAREEIVGTVIEAEQTEQQAAEDQRQLPQPQSKTAALLAKIAARKEQAAATGTAAEPANSEPANAQEQAQQDQDAPSLNAVLEAIAAATSKEDLDAVANRAMKLRDDEKDTARRAFMQRVAEIKAAAQ